MPATPAPTPFSHGPGGVRPEDLAAGISRLSVIQEAADTSPQVAINVLEATDNSNTSNLSNYFGSPQSSVDSIFDQLSAPPGTKARSRSNSSSGTGFHDVTISTPAKIIHIYIDTFVNKEKLVKSMLWLLARCLMNQAFGLPCCQRSKTTPDIVFEFVLG